MKKYNPKEIEKIAKDIKSIEWENRVQRTGFLQSKTIINEAETQKVKLTPRITVRSKNIFWIKDSNLYDQKFVENLSKIFEKAFKEDEHWPSKIEKAFDQFGKDKDKLIKELNKDWNPASTKTKIETFIKYEKLLKDFQKYYIIAVPLTNYCESEIKRLDVSLLEFAASSKQLDVDKMHKDLLKIKNAKSKEIAINEYLKKYAWIKTAYNIIEEYTRGEVLKELKHVKNNQNYSSKSNYPKSKYVYLLKALNGGIYLRNRMKELSQQLWYAVEPLGHALANDLSMNRDDFFQLTLQEIIYSLKRRKCVVDRGELLERHKGFVMGILDGKEIIFTGKMAEELHNFFNKKEIGVVSEIKGSIACKGKIISKVKVIINKNEFDKLKKGEVLVASMTTPDYVIIMKHAGAIVTDEGGLSCHAAIVSRELGVPCIIGTKIATKVLKDGDLVEVDADNGVVKVIKKA